MITAKELKETVQANRFSEDNFKFVLSQIEAEIIKRAGEGRTSLTIRATETPDEVVVFSRYKNGVGFISFPADVVVAELIKHGYDCKICYGKPVDFIDLIDFIKEKWATRNGLVYGSQVEISW